MPPSAVSDAVVIRAVRGGATRTESVRNGLQALPTDCDLVAVHDAARPFWPLNRWDQLVEEALRTGGAILSVPLADTIKRARGERCTTVDRRGLWAAQTPQVFRAKLLREAHVQAERDAYSGTDDAELVERIGGAVAIVPSTRANFKITTPEDWEQAERMAMTTQRVHPLRVGLGYDAHRLGGDGALMLGGMQLAPAGGLIGHSDGDVLLHAICDALLGAAALGDIGRHFPPGDPEFAGIDSRVLVRRTRAILHDAGFRVHQIDAVVMAEAPRLAPHIEAMRSVIAGDLGIEPAMVSVKATTTEKMGFVGRGEGIAAQAIVTVVSEPDPADGSGR